LIRTAGTIALLGDAHLREGDPEVGAFVTFLDALPGSASVLAILGDLFAAWLGRADLVRPHHDQVVAALRRLGGRGVRVLYVEGNHDFFLNRLYGGDPFETIAEVSLELEHEGKRLHLAHGDLMNRHDRQYRAWRRLSKSRPFFAAFNLLPRATRLRLVEGLERGMAATNMEFRGGFPVGECLAYARPRFRAGTDAIVFGHFHDERRLDITEGDRRGAVYVLPAWRDGHRYLRIAPGTAPVFVSS
jgi:UDP-2,3-diacylglucosamine hydrolase